MGEGARRRRDAVRGGRRGRAPRGAPGRCAGHDLHRLAGPPADDPQHVQDRRRADARGHPCRRPDDRHPRALDLRRPQRRHACPCDGLGDAGGRVGPGSARLRPRGPRRHAPGTGPVPAFLRRLPHLARDRPDRDPRRRRHPRPGARGRCPRLPRPGHDARSAGRPRHRPEPGRVLPGPRGVEPVPPRRARDRRGGVRGARRADRPSLWPGRLSRRARCRARRRGHGLRRRCPRGDGRRLDRRRRARRDAADPPLPAVPGRAAAGGAAADGALHRGPRPDQGAGGHRGAALPRRGRGARGGDGRRPAAVRDGPAGHRRTLRPLVEGTDPVDAQAGLRCPRHGASAAPLHARHRGRRDPPEPAGRCGLPARAPGRRGAGALLRPRVRWHRRGEQGLGQDHRRGLGPLRPGLLRLRLQEVRVDHRVASPLRAGAHPLHLPRGRGGLHRLPPVRPARPGADAGVREAGRDVPAQRAVRAGRGLGAPAARGAARRSSTSRSTCG